MSVGGCGLGGSSSMQGERKDLLARLGSFFAGAMAPRLGLLLAAFAVAGCKVDNVPEGALIVALETDLALPKDIDRVRVEWSQDGRVLHTEEQELGEGHMLLPADFRVRYPGNDRPLLIRAVAWSGKDARIERSAVTPVPHTFVGVVRLPLSFLCTGQVTAAGESSCGQDQTCRQGECSTAVLSNDEVVRFTGDSKSRSNAVRAAVDGGGSGLDASTLVGGAAEQGCFDVASCFSSLYDVDVELETCAFTLPFDLPLPHLNIALRQPLGRDGICDNGSCFVVLDSDPRPSAPDTTPFEGFRVDQGRVRLPPGVCKRIRKGEPLQVTMSFSCNAKTFDNPPCGAWSSVQNPRPQPQQSTDSGQGIAVGVPGGFLGQACAGAARQACGMCGTQGRDCKEGTWSSWVGCMGEGTCVPGKTEPCGRGGMKTCGGDCGWGECLSQTCEGATSRACGNCGTQMRRCDNGVWSEWSECTGPGVCAPNAARSCGSGGNQSCGGNCQWGNCTNQVCVGAASEACGNCGTRTRTCDADTGRWSEFGACEEQGACAPDSTRECGRDGTQSCRGDCSWDGACTGQMCEGESTRSCGNCGTQTRSCNTDTGTWSDWSACRGQGECSANATRACGSGGTQVCGGNCRWDDACTGQTCSGTALQSCGNCGVQTRRCDSTTGRWSEFSSCSNEGSCTPGDSRPCGSGGTQTCGPDCRWRSQCTDQSCAGSATESCGNCGTRTRTCNSNTGTWSGFGPCMDEGECRPQSTRDCGRDGTQSCGRDCRWQTACTDQTCTGENTRSCDRCGHESRTCNPNTGMWNGWSQCTGQLECNLGETLDCGSGGKRKCNADCRWDSACNGQMCPLPAPKQDCGNCGSQTAICDMSTGRWTSRWDACTGQGECKEGDKEGCQNGGSYTCTRQCRYDRTQCLGQMCAGPKPADKACGNCGHQVASCDGSTGKWTYGDCIGQGECKPGTPMTCGDGGMKVCSPECRYPRECGCTGEKPSQVACGNCGYKVATCDPANGTWKYGACLEEGECAAGTDGDCGPGGVGTHKCDPKCHWPTTCECKGTAPGNKNCEQCGHQVASCNKTNGTWEYGACTDKGECDPNAMPMKCGEGGLGSRTCSKDDCSWSKVCSCTTPQPNAETCEQCGTKSYSCDPVNGVWVAGDCTNKGECVADSTSREGCEDGAEKTCSMMCKWGTCTAKCSDGLTLCDGKCVNTDTDRNYCRSCTNKCGANQVCISDGCATCDTGTHFCAPNRCALNTSRDSCGTRCEPCPGKQECQRGECVDPLPIGGSGGSGGKGDVGGSGGTGGNGGGEGEGTGGSGQGGGAAGQISPPRGAGASGGNPGGAGSTGSVPPLL